MPFAVTVKDAQDLRRLIPLNILSASRFEELCAKTGIEEVARGTVLFNQGDAKNEFVYVLSGTVSLQAGGMEMETITGGTESARFALAHQIPRKVSAIAKDRVRYIRVDAAYVNQPSEKSAGTIATYEVSDIPSDAGDDWITTLLKSPIFQRLPPANLQNILSLLEEAPVRAGQEIIHQDEPGDYYYIIKRGRCALTRKPSRLAREIKLAELKTTDTFGEDALISDQPRNVTVTMMTDGILLRLNKANFLKLVKEPVINFVNMDAAKRMLQQGARWLDVRAPDSFEEGHLPGAVNIPFFRLRTELSSLSHQFKYILLCETGKVSEAAAFLLIRYEFEAFVLKGGVSGIFKDQLITDEKAAVAASSSQAPLPPRVQAPAVQAGALELEPAIAVPREIPFTPAGGPAAVDLGGVRKDIADLAHTLGQLQDKANSLQSAETRLEAQVQAAEAHAEEAIRHLESVRTDIATVRESDSSHFLPSDQDFEKRLADLRRERDDLEERLRAAEDRRVVLEADWRKAMEAAQEGHSVLEMALAEAKTENERLYGQLQQMQSACAQADEAEAGVDVARLRQEHDRVLERNRELEGQVAELSSLVQEFVDQHGQSDDTVGEESDALRTELEMVRSQAAEDVIAMQRKLRDVEHESARLRSELETAQQNLLLHEAGATRVAAKGRGSSVWAPIAAVLGVLLLGTAVAIAFALATDSGREMTLQLIGPQAQSESPPALQ